MEYFDVLDKNRNFLNYIKDIYYANIFSYFLNITNKIFQLMNIFQNVIYSFMNVGSICL